MNDVSPGGFDFLSGSDDCLLGFNALLPYDFVFFIVCVFLSTLGPFSRLVLKRIVMQIMLKVAHIVDNIQHNILISTYISPAARSLDGLWPYAMSSRDLFFSGRGVGMDMADISQKPSGVLFGAHC